MIVTIASSDKLSIAMFLSFLMKNLGRDYRIGECHSFMTPESLAACVESLLKMNKDKVVFTYFAKKKNHESCIPENLIKTSDAVIWFSQYETSYKVLKDTVGFNDLFLDTWNKNLKQLGG